MSREALKICLAKYPSMVKPYSEEQLGRAFNFLREKMMPIWSATRVWSYEEALDDCDLTKGSGYPYHYKAPSKEDALDKYAQEIEQDVRTVLVGDVDGKVYMPSCLTMKDELRTEDRVLAHKTRGFNASHFVHLLASKQLFGEQNNLLHKARSTHPVTLGIGVPGDEYVSRVLKLGKRAFDADGDGYDLNVNLGLMRVIREVRKSFLPKEYHAAVDLLYDCIYCGDTISAGVIYRLICQKSGWANTGDDNSLHLWLAEFLAHEELGGDVDTWESLINGDDFATGDLNDPPCPYGITEIAAVMAKYGVKISFDNAEARPAWEITFLSHHIKERFVPLFGDMLICAGNRHKLRSSLNWVQSNETLTFEESCLAHLLGLRLCLWPWKDDFMEVEDLIDDFLAKIIVKTPKMLEILKARLTEEHIARVHVGMESGFVFSPDSTLVCPEVLAVVDQVTNGHRINN